MSRLKSLAAGVQSLGLKALPRFSSLKAQYITSTVSSLTSQFTQKLLIAIIGKASNSIVLLTNYAVYNSLYIIYPLLFLVGSALNNSQRGNFYAAQPLYYKENKTKGAALLTTCLRNYLEAAQLLYSKILYVQYSCVATLDYKSQYKI